ncbi:MAG: glycosyltransferase [Cyanobacteria bacterium SBLK]|nr:glycosyltransferase [Cyanobacteria bacterium SBLK]
MTRKILHIIPSINPFGGGSNLAAIEIVKALRYIGIDAEIATTNDIDLEIPKSSLSKIQEFKNVPIRFFPRLFANFKPLSEFKISLDYTRWLEQNIQNYKIVHIHSFFSYLCTRGAITARKYNTDYVITPHGQLDSWVINQKKVKKSIYSFLWERKNLNYATAIHCTTNKEVDDVQKYGISAPTFIAPLAASQITHEPDSGFKVRKMFCEIPKVTPIILFLSRIHQKKRIDFLIQVLYQLKNECEFHLIIAGTGNENYVKKIKMQVSKLNLQKRVTFAGFIQGQQKELLLQGSDIFVLPSFGENFCIAVVEAMLAGLPIVTTPEVQISADFQNEKVGFIIPGKIQIWVETIKKLLKSGDMRQEMGDRGKLFAANHYRWKITGERLASLYSNILDKNPPN